MGQKALALVVLSYVLQGLLSHETHLTMTLKAVDFSLTSEAYIAWLLFTGKIAVRIMEDDLPPGRPLQQAYLEGVCSRSSVQWALGQLEDHHDFAKQESHAFETLVLRLPQGQPCTGTTDAKSSVHHALLSYTPKYYLVMRMLAKLLIEWHMSVGNGASVIMHVTMMQ